MFKPILEFSKVNFKKIEKNKTELAKINLLPQILLKIENQRSLIFLGIQNTFDFSSSNSFQLTKYG
ncbi:hypothetical protein [Mycoplasma testudineum]|uniref:hypothetical protein n=1 Tax=Mycoplasma testudineum TaxID=244584 RepID=UPI00105BD3AA|nr:hypothetical protein [Mycoplasma testudineum]